MEYAGRSRAQHTFKWPQEEDRAWLLKKEILCALKEAPS